MNILGKLIKFPFTKWQGCGNDFVMIDGFANAIAEEDYAAVSKAACDRHYGIGADGIILLLPSDKADIRMRIINADGSEAEMCGNGIRCFAALAYNLGMVKDKCWDILLDEIVRIKAACGGKLLKVIIECCLLTDEEKIKLCEIVSASGAEYIKTSTGFSKGGATFDDVALMRAHCAPAVKVKAAGGIRTLEDAKAMLKAGATRLGTSAGRALVDSLP